MLFRSFHELCIFVLHCNFMSSRVNEFESGACKVTVPATSERARFLVGRRIERKEREILQDSYDVTTTWILGQIIGFVVAKRSELLTTQGQSITFDHNRRKPTVSVMEIAHLFATERFEWHSVMRYLPIHFFALVQSNVKTLLMSPIYPLQMFETRVVQHFVRKPL